MKRSTLLIIAVNIYGIIAAVLTVLGVLRTPIIIIPFIITPFIISPLHKSLANTRYDLLSLGIVAVVAIAIIIALVLVLTS